MRSSAPASDFRALAKLWPAALSERQTKHDALQPKSRWPSCGLTVFTLGANLQATVLHDLHGDSHTRTGVLTYLITNAVQQMRQMGYGDRRKGVLSSAIEMRP